MGYKGKCPECGSGDIFGAANGVWNGTISLDGEIETTDIDTTEIEWTCNECGNSGFDVHEEFDTNK